MNVKYTPKSEDSGSLSFGRHTIDVRQTGHNRYETPHIPAQWNIISKAERIELLEKKPWQVEDAF